MTKLTQLKYRSFVQLAVPKFFGVITPTLMFSGGMIATSAVSPKSQLDRLDPKFSGWLMLSHLGSPDGERRVTGR